MGTYKLLVAFLIAGILLSILFLTLAGRKLRASKEAHGAYDELLLLRHRTFVAVMGCLTLLAVCLIETQSRLSENTHTVSPWLFGTHLFFDGALILIGAIIILRITGKKNPLWHRRLVYFVFYSLFAVVIATGGVLLYLQPRSW